MEPAARGEAAGRDVRSGTGPVPAPVLPEGAAQGDGATGSGAAEYAGGLLFGEFLAILERRHPRLHALLDPKCRDDRQALPEVLALNRLSWEFEGQQDGGRGVEYNRAQRNIDNRRIGMTRLLSLFGPEDGGVDGLVPGPETVILDVLAGDGTLRRFAERFGERRPEIVSADLSRLMVEACLAQGYPCIRQSAVSSFFGDGMLDGVLIAYGSHHLSAEDRRRAAAEAHRTLKPGGRFVLHDFETGGAVDGWFREAVDRYSITGHPYPHFTRGEMTDLLEGAGFARIRVFDMEDPFTLAGASAAEARENMLRHLHSMYGLVKLSLTDPGDRGVLESLARRTLGEIRVEPADGHFEATLRRPALVAVGTR